MATFIMKVTPKPEPIRKHRFIVSVEFSVFEDYLPDLQKYVEAMTSAYEVIVGAHDKRNATYTGTISYAARGANTNDITRRFVDRVVITKTIGRIRTCYCGTTESVSCTED